MGIENMRRWPMYIVFAVCILLTLSLFNSWTTETELRNKLIESQTQLKECSRHLETCTQQQTSCMEESLALVEQKQTYLSKLREMELDKTKLKSKVAELKNKAEKSESLVNRTFVDVEFCKTELQSLKNLQLSKSATLETLRLEKDTLTANLNEKKRKIDDLLKEIEKLKSALTTKSGSNPASPKITPAAEPPKLSPSLNANNPINEPVIENNAQEELEDPNNPLNDNEIDQQIQ